MRPSRPVCYDWHSAPTPMGRFGTFVVMRRVRPEADLFPAEPSAYISVRGVGGSNPATPTNT